MMLWSLAILSQAFSLVLIAAQRVDKNFYGHPGVSAAEILRARGFQADELFCTTSTGYKLRVTRARNPLIRGGSLADKDPILFIHGVLASANAFVINSLHVEPKDLSAIDLRRTNLSKLNELLSDEPSAKSLATLALNFGHEIFLLDRRGAPGSQGLKSDSDNKPARLNHTDKTGKIEKSVEPTRQRHANSTGPLSSLINVLAATSQGALAQQISELDANAGFWNFSLDEQARVDLPEVVDFVLETSGHTKLGLVTHSAGGAIALMAQSLFPEQLAPKISVNILWAPAFSASNRNPSLSSLLGLIRPMLASYLGPLPPTSATPLIQAALGLVCSSPLARATVCTTFFDAFFGSGGGLEPIRPELSSALFFSSSTRELGQFAQMLDFSEPRSMRFYDFGPEQNKLVYGQGHTMPPAYNLTRLRNAPGSLSFYAGSSDSQVTPADVATTRRQVPFASHLHEIEAPLSHAGYFFSEHAPRRVVIPSMRELEVLGG